MCRRNHRLLTTTFAWTAFLVAAPHGFGQPLGEPDRGAPGDGKIQEYLRNEAVRLDAAFDQDRADAPRWADRRPEYERQYLYMLGLDPRPESTPLRATVTRTLERDGYAVDMLHYQSRPGLYVTANLYRPARVPEGTRLPAILYVCGHSGRGRDGNKVAYQSHGIWFAKHGYLCLIVDTLQLGEIAATHHGTYRYERWWWHSRGYTPAGVEAWNGIRGIDYLVSRDDVDASRIAVTGISGGGAATFWVAAADPRVMAAVPVSGMADLESYVGNRVINGHCDCMFLHNAFQWPWTRIAGLIAPRPLLFVNSDQDPIFPMDANERIINRLERLYSLTGASADVDAVVSVGGHAYREDIRRASYQFLERHLRRNAAPVTDGEMDVVSEGGQPGKYPIEPEQLRVFATDADLPADELNTTIDERFVPLAVPDRPAAGEFDAWRSERIREWKQVTFGSFPDEIPAAELDRSALSDNGERVDVVTAERPLEVVLRFRPRKAKDRANETWLAVLNEEEAGTVPDWLNRIAPADQDIEIVLCEPRGMGVSRWTKKNPPNYVERSLVLLGRTVDTGRIRDVAAAARYVRTVGVEPDSTGSIAPRRIAVCGRGAAGILAAYAAVFCPEIERVAVVVPPVSHMDPGSPRLLNVLRVFDIPDALGLAAPRPMRLIGADAGAFSATAALYRSAGAADAFRVE
ncbi:MAG: hypothetical protein FJ297_16170 [Planctomycetes bacterium]|nr:hypothetical protein [Planctomycetota bacterium]